ncbi:hypothetical protein BuS5_00523 [Desulfosarcina sp. BuS5]|nr:hypothetical protein BuS5_00523 [Desulfosarcina sp. BuS5]
MKYRLSDNYLILKLGTRPDGVGGQNLEPLPRRPISQ